MAHSSLRNYYYLITALVIAIIYFLSTDGNNSNRREGGGQSQGTVEKISPGLTHFTHTRNATGAKYLMPVLTHDDGSWRKFNNDTPRTVDAYLELLGHTGIPKEEMSLAIMTNAESAYNFLVAHLPQFEFAKVQVLLHIPQQVPGAPEAPKDRHSDAYQPYRRQQLALARNILMLRALGNEEEIFWYDADVLKSEDGILKRMLDHINDPEAHLGAKNNHSGRQLPIGLITARVQNGGDTNYDRNAWAHGPDGALARKIPTDAELADATSDKPFVPNKAPGMVDVDYLTSHTGDEDLFWLDSVGGVILHMKADLVRMGLNFPSYYAVRSCFMTPHRLLY